MRYNQDAPLPYKRKKQKQFEKTRTALLNKIETLEQEIKNKDKENNDLHTKLIEQQKLVLRERSRLISKTVPLMPKKPS